MAQQQEGTRRGAQEAAEGGRRAAHEATEGAKRGAQEFAEGTRRATQEAGEGARRFTEEVTERGGRAVLAAAEIYNETAQLTAEDFQAIATCSTIAAGGMTEMRQAWMEWLNRSLRTGARTSQMLLRCTTLDQFADIQRSFLKESFDNLLEGSAQMLRISGRISENALRPIEDRVSQTRGGE